MGRRFLGVLLECVALKVTGGTPGAGKVLTSDSSGNGTWQDPVVGPTSTVTFTNKRITERVSSPSFSATPTINTDSVDIVELSGLSGAITSLTTNLTGTPTNGQTLIVKFKDNGSARAITPGASFTAFSAALPTTTVAGKWKEVVFQYFSDTSKWRCMSVLDEI